MVNDVNYNSDIRDMIIANLDGWQVTNISPEPPEPLEPVEPEVEDDTVEPVDNPTDESTETEPTNNTPTPDLSNNEVEPFMSRDEIQNKPNKKITDNECKLFYEEALDLAYMHTNRLNIDDLTSVEAKVFLRAVCKWAASNLWNKYNIRVNNEDLEDTYIQSYGGLLYKSALKTLQPFINQRVRGLSANNPDKDTNGDVWIL